MIARRMPRRAFSILATPAGEALERAKRSSVRLLNFRFQPNSVHPAFVGVQGTGNATPDKRAHAERYVSWTAGSAAARWKLPGRK
jgi:hypothetical protein